MCGFQVGDEVVCVDASYNDGRPPLLKEGATYRVAGVILASGRSGLTGRFEGPHPALHLAEVVGYSRTGAFNASRFRKVQRRKTDLSIESFLTIKPGFEEPRRPGVPAKRERV